MARWFECPYLGGEAELTDEREAHIRQKHSDVLARGFDLIALVLAEPDVVRLDPQGPNTLKFSRWYDEGGHGRHAVVIVVRDQAAAARNWIVTAFPARRIPEGDVIWRRS
jgi:hypothetical protein